MKRKSIFFVPFLLAAGLCTIALNPGQVETPAPPTPTAEIILMQPTPLPDLDENAADIVPFSALQTIQTGTSQIKSLQGPLDNVHFSFALPPDWDVNSGSRLALRCRVIVSSLVATQGSVNYENMAAGQITVTFDEQVISSEILKGNQSFLLEIPLPEAAFAGPDAVAHDLTIVWDAQASCGYNVATSLLIDGKSHLSLPHQERALSLDLSAFPQPLYIEQGIQNPAITLIIPDDSSQAHLQSALTIAAGLGRISSGKAEVGLSLEGELTDDVRKANHLVFIGLVEEFTRIDQAIAESQNALSPLPGGGGTVQMLASPWNPARVVLLAGGENADGILKASQAISIGVLSPAAQENLAVIEDVRLPDPAKDYTEDMTFAKLKIPERTFTNFGSNVIEISFSIPPGTSIGSEAYLDLVFGHSQMLDYIRSGLTIRLNGIPIGSARFSDTTAVGSTLRTMLPSSVLRNGENDLEVQADLFPRDICTDERLNNLFIVVFTNSLLHLPSVNQPADIPRVAYIDSYPEPYIDNPNLSDTAVVLPAGAPGAWRVAARLAYSLGERTSGVVSAPAAYLADSVPGDLLQTHNIILIGRPSAFPFLPSWKSALPATFTADDAPSPEISLPVSFLSSPSASWGYLAIGNAAGKTVFGVLGNNDEGIEAAERILNDPTARNKLTQGNFAVVQRRSLMVADIQPVVIVPAGEEVPAPEGEGVPPPAGAQPSEALPVEYGKPDAWILPTMIVSLVLIILICGWQIRNALKKS